MDTGANIVVPVAQHGRDGEGRSNDKASRRDLRPEAEGSRQDETIKVLLAVDFLVHPKQESYPEPGAELTVRTGTMQPQDHWNIW